MRRGALAAVLFLLPNAVGLLTFAVLPILAAAGISLTDWDALTPPRFVGLANLAALQSDRLFHQVVLNTLAFTLAVGLRFFLDAGSVGYHLLMAASLTALAPTFLVFLPLQRHFTRGLTLTGFGGP